MSVVTICLAGVGILACLGILAWGTYGVYKLSKFLFENKEWFDLVGLLSLFLFILVILLANILDI